MDLITINTKRHEAFRVMYNTNKALLIKEGLRDSITRFSTLSYFPLNGTPGSPDSWAKAVLNIESNSRRNSIRFSLSNRISPRIRNHFQNPEWGDPGVTFNAKKPRVENLVILYLQDIDWHDVSVHYTHSALEFLHNHMLVQYMYMQQLVSNNTAVQNRCGHTKCENKNPVSMWIFSFWVYTFVI
jgi:hypothetical protein